MTAREENPALIQKALEGFDNKKLTIGFARRFATYKRAQLLFTNLPRLAEIVNHPTRPVQFVFAGKAHPADRAGGVRLRSRFGDALQRERRHGGGVDRARPSRREAGFHFRHTGRLPRPRRSELARVHPDGGGGGDPQLPAGAIALGAPTIDDPGLILWGGIHEIHEIAGKIIDGTIKSPID